MTAGPWCSAEILIYTFFFFLIDVLYCYKCSFVVYIHSILLLPHSMAMLPKEYIGNIPLPFFRKLVKTFLPTFIFTIENAVLFDSYLWSCVWPYLLFSQSCDLHLCSLCISCAVNLIESKDYLLLMKTWIYLIMCIISLSIYLYSFLYWLANDCL